MVRRPNIFEGFSDHAENTSPKSANSPWGDTSRVAILVLESVTTTPALLSSSQIKLTALTVSLERGDVLGLAGNA